MTAGGILAAVRGVMAVFIIAGIRLSRRHTSTFSFGLYKLENIIAAVVGVIVLIVTYELAKVSITHLSSTYLFTNDPKYALPFFLGAAVLARGMGFYKRRVARGEGCPSLKADASFSYFLSFVIIAMFWISHDSLSSVIQRVDKMLIWLNIFYLLLIVFMPYPTILLSLYGQTAVATALYASVLAAAGILQGSMGFYVVRGRRLVDDYFDLRRRVHTRGTPS